MRVIQLDQQHPSLVTSKRFGPAWSESWCWQPGLGWGRGTAGVPRWPHGRAHHSQAWGAGHVSCKNREQKYLDPLEQPHHFFVPPSARDGSKVLASHTSVACSRSPCFKCKGGREVMIRDTLK